MASAAPSESRALVPANAAQVMGQVRSFAAQPAVAKSLPLLGLIALLGLAALAWSLFSQPAQRNLFAGLADGDKAAVADALSTAGIKYTLDRDTGTLSVPDADFYRARMLLAQQGLPKSAPDGDQMIASLPLGASRAVEGERLRSAREMDLARTIEAIDAISQARVHLAMEQPSVFMRDANQPAASVMLTLRSGRSLSDAQVKAIAHLVASSVPGLQPDSVSIVDQSGKLLSRNGGDPTTDAAERQVEIQQNIENRYADAVSHLLTPLLGAGNFTAEVHADVDFSEVQATRESYPQTGAVRQENGGWTREGGPEGPGGLGGGVPGAIANAPSAAATASNTAPGTPGANGAPGAPGTGTPSTPPAAPPRTTENYARTFELGHEVSVTRQPVGSIRRLSVAVALKQPEHGRPRSSAEIAALENLVKGAVGFDQTRGDLIAVSARAFAPDEAPVAPKWWEAPWVALLARNVSALLITLVVVFGVGRPLLKRLSNRDGAPAEKGESNRSVMGQQIAAALTSEVRADPGHTVTLDMIEAAPGYAARAELIRNFVRQDPARAALVVRDLIRVDAAEPRNG